MTAPLPNYGDVKVTWAEGVHHPDGLYRVLHHNRADGRRLFAHCEEGVPYHPGAPAFWALPKDVAAWEKVL